MYRNFLEYAFLRGLLATLSVSVPCAPAVLTLLYQACEIIGPRYAIEN
jgi:hypothetical protein